MSLTEFGDALPADLGINPFDEFTHVNEVVPVARLTISGKVIDELEAMGTTSRRSRELCDFWPFTNEIPIHNSCVHLKLSI
ncbi:hypothetical protein [Mycobacteroides abscessus]|uniref:hypothetical protein n=1 Tax=Mycobacteroides abscessus TaxID=36809 RepID=UPI000943D56C|nr:hypothetical protein [Mycobacteroides abscessus]